MATTAPTLQNFIASEAVDPAEGQTEPIINPATDEVIAQAPLSSAEDVDRAVHAARDAFDGWAAATPGERASALLELADTIEEHADELAELESDKAGKPISAFRDDEIPFMVDNLRFFAGAARCLEGRAASAARCASRRGCDSGRCRSTITSRSPPRCRMEASSSPATART